LLNKRLSRNQRPGCTDSVNTRYLEDDIDEIPRDREISLGATTILGLFFLLALVCAVFFGVGYSMGRKSSAVAIAAPSSESVEASTIKTTNAPKPSAAQDLPAESATEPEAADTAPQLPQPRTQPAAQQPATRATKASAAKSAAAPEVASVTRPAPSAPTAAASGPAVPSIVQVAAVSHQEDADMLVNALKRRGYNVAVHRVPQDKLLHVQIGPLASRKDADAMRQRLLADGYQAIVK
jgi:DedD protein